MSQSIKFFTDNVLDHSWRLNKQVEQGEFRPLRTFESIVVGCSSDEDRYRQSGERQLAQTLRQCFLRNRMADTSVAILERMNGHEVQMCNPGPPGRAGGEDRARHGDDHPPARN